jgi:steroid delta-isomerase-like uncharacterized protein
MSEENKALVRRALEDVWNRGDLVAADEIFAGDVVMHHPTEPEPIHGLEGFKRFPVMLRAGFPDLKVTVEQLIAEGDRVGARWTIRGTHRGSFMDVPPTGRQVTIPINEVLRVSDGRIQELWLELNVLGVAQQLGVIPPLEKLPPQLLWLIGRGQRLGAKVNPRSLAAVGALALTALAARKLIKRRRNDAESDGSKASSDE